VPVTADVADDRQVQSIAAAAERAYGRLDTWAHIAAVGLYATFQQTTPDEFKRVVDVNLLGEVYGARAALPLLARQGGALICVSSVEARRALPFHSAYSAAKHGVDGFLEALRVELRHDRIPVSVTEIMPASINTPFFDKSRTKIGVKPMGFPPLYDPRTVAEAILYAAEHPTREIIVGGAGKALLGMQRLSPRLLDGLLLLAGFRGQKTNEPRSADAPNNLFGPAGRYNRVEGDFGTMTEPVSIATWLDLHPTVKAAVTVGAALGLGAVLAQKTGKGQEAVSTVARQVPAGLRPPGM
jgi:short-subunit dehydrogenase